MMRYRVTIKCDIEQLDSRGYPMSNGGLHMQDHVELGDQDFGGLMKVLGTFHDVAVSLTPKVESDDD